MNDEERGIPVNALIWAAVVVASLWLSVYAFVDLSEPALGLVGIGLFLVSLVVTIVTAHDDFTQVFGKRE